MVYVCLFVVFVLLTIRILNFVFIFAEEQGSLPLPFGMTPDMAKEQGYLCALISDIIILIRVMSIVEVSCLFAGEKLFIVFVVLRILRLMRLSV